MKDRSSDDQRSFLDKYKGRIILLAILAVVTLISTTVLYSQIWETNFSGYYKVKQTAYWGTMSVVNNTGTFTKAFGTVHPYQVSDMYYFSTSDEEGGSGKEADPISIRFNGGSTAFISGSIKYRLSRVDSTQLLLHEDFKSYAAVKQDLIRQTVAEALKQTATLMKAEESYSSRRSEFTTVAEGQVRNGIYMTEKHVYKYKDAQDQEFIKREVKIKLDSNKQPVVMKGSPFKTYDIEILQFVIKDIDYDPTIDSLIAEKKEIEQNKAVSKSKAETAKQNAITKEMQGTALIAEAKALEEVKKIQAVTEALKEKEVAILKAEKNYKIAQLGAREAIEKAKKIIAEGRAEATANKLKVAAGLSPQEKASWKYKTEVGIANALKDINVPGIVIVGGKQSSGANPLDMIGINMALDIQKKMKK
jgi:regulator of protease activity HflC (stomatin/prohibitin superfamily)